MDIHVAVYEDNDALRESLTHLIKGSHLMTFAGAYSNCVRIVENCREDMPDIILMDIDMPGISGIEGTRLVKEAFPSVNVMILTVYEDRDKIFDALRAGATGYILKKSSAIQIIEAVIELFGGGSPMSSQIARKVLEFFTEPSNGKENEYQLTDRELDILKRLISGDSYKMISEHCDISIGTVRCHINSMYRKLAVNSKSEAVIKAIKERIV